MNHKRKGPKSTRAGCLMCKPHKHQAHKNDPRFKRRTERVADVRQADAQAENTTEPNP